MHSRPMLDRLREIVAQRCEDGAVSSSFNGEPDHVHVLVELPPNLQLSRFVNNVKTTSTSCLTLTSPHRPNQSKARSSS